MLSWLIIIFIVLFILRINFRKTIDTIYESNEDKTDYEVKDNIKMHTKDVIDADFKILEEDDKDIKE